jgi:hypothetical protein
MANDTVIRSLHDLGLASWFGGSLAGAMSLSRRQGGVDQAGASERGGEDWAAWSPIALASIGAHLIGGAGLILTNRQRHKQQSSVMATTMAKTVITGAALGATAYASTLGSRLRHLEAESGGQPALDQQQQVARIRSRLMAVGWSVPVLTAILVVLGAREGELQRPSEGLRGIAPDAVSRLGRGLGEAAGQLRDTVSERVEAIDTDQLTGAFGGLRDAVLDKVPFDL